MRGMLSPSGPGPAARRDARSSRARRPGPARSTRTRRGPSTAPARRRSYRVVAYGDSIYAGYRGSIFNVAKRAAPMGRRRVPVEHVERRHRGRSAAPSRAPWPTTSTTTRSSPSARTCRRRTRASSPSRCAATTTCRRAAASPARAAPATTAPVDNALANCTNYTAAGDATHQPVRHHRDAEDGLEPLLSRATTPTTRSATAPTRRPGSRSTSRAQFLPVLAQSNWRACNLAAQHGFACADSFAQYMGADYDSNGDGQIDSDALRYVPGRVGGGLRARASRRRCARRSATPTRTS